GEARPYGYGGGGGGYGYRGNYGGYGHGGYGHGWYGHGGYYYGGYGYPYWGGIGIGIGLGLGAYYYGRPYYPGYYVEAPPAYQVQTVPAQPAPQPQPDPVIYPNNGQTAAQTEADRQACDRWATTQPSAMADASVFHR